jgi:hypothetical protein
MKFIAMSVTVEPAVNGIIEVDVSYALVNPLEDASASPDVVSLETIPFAAGTKRIERLNGLKVSGAEAASWLAARGSSWNEWNAREYLTFRLDT